MNEQRRSPVESKRLSVRTVVPFALFLVFLALWTYELLAENPVPASISRAIPDAWKFWLAKGLHVGAYAFLTLLAVWLPVHRSVFWLVVAGLLVHGIGTEVGQWFTTNRQGSIRDVLLDWRALAWGC